METYAKRYRCVFKYRRRIWLSTVIGVGDGLSLAIGFAGTKFSTDRFILGNYYWVDISNIEGRIMKSNGYDCFGQHS